MITAVCIFLDSSARLVSTPCTSQHHYMCLLKQLLLCLGSLVNL
jgi:hypothetical protein